MIGRIFRRLIPRLSDAFASGNPQRQNPPCTKSARIMLSRGLIMTLIIRDVLLNPPTWFSSFRDLTLYCHVFLRIDCVIETEDADPYYRWIKWRGGMDFVEDFVRPGSERGLRLDVDRRHPPMVVTDRIAPENMQRLLIQIQSAHGT
jgi:hypothetical protein